MPDLTTSYEGSCQCQHIQYKIHTEPSTMYLCHCKDCQKQSSSAFGISLWVHTNGFELITGELSHWKTHGDSGGTKQCTYCCNCGSRIYHVTGPGDTYLSLKAGCLNNLKNLEPIAHIWTDSAQHWFKFNDELPCFPREPSSDEVLLSLWQLRKKTSQN